MMGIFKYLHLIILSFEWTLIGANEFTVNCTSVCSRVETSFESEDLLDCDVKCRGKKCIDGCVRWRKGIDSSCQDVCGQSVSSNAEDNIECTLGCVYASQTYFHGIKDSIGEPQAPQLLEGSVKSTSLGLRWHGNDAIADITYLVQYRQGSGTGEWSYYKAEQPITESSLTITDLKPYTKYQFRIAWILLPNHGPLFSMLSLWLSTLQSGPPASTPRNVVAIPLDWSRIKMSWDPPLYPGGDIVSYSLSLRDVNSREEIRKDVRINDGLSFIVPGLSSNTTYQLNLTAVNNHGSGPAAVIKVTTYTMAEVSSDGTGFILVSCGPKLLRLGVHVTNSPKVIFNTSSGADITGLAVHIPLRMVYVCDTTGSIYQILLRTSKQRIFLKSTQTRGVPITLSVDWLFGFVYFVSIIDEHREWEIWRCDLAGKQIEIVIQGLSYEPKSLEVDPYNGYLWWISTDVDSGLHRMGLGKKLRTNIGSNFQSKVVLRYSNLGDLSLDPENFKVVLADQVNNTILAVSLDGNSVKNIRDNTQQAAFEKVSSLAYLNGKFFWTNGSRVFTEDLHGGTVYHNSYSMNCEGEITNLIGVHRSLQPVPVPRNPPTKVQALFTKDSATITWQPPQLAALKGKEAWQQWYYDVHIQVGQKIIYEDSLTRTSHTISNLTPGMEHQIKVRATSRSGSGSSSRSGPFSTSFRGRTLSENSVPSRVAMATSSEIYITRLDNGSPTPVPLSKEAQMILREKNLSDLSYFEDIVVLSSQNQTSVLVNLTTGEANEIDNFYGVISTDVDWATGKVFGSQAFNNAIVWKSLRKSTHTGILKLITGALQIEVDSTRGLLYWMTRFEILVSTLTGRNLIQIHRENIFSGKQVEGLAINPALQEVYWILTDRDGPQLFVKVTGGSDVREIKSLNRSYKRGSLSYCYERLFWISEDGELIVFDPQLSSSAVVPSGHLGIMQYSLQMVQHKDPSTLHLDPNPVNSTSLQLEGTWKNFSITWQPLETPSFGSLEYEITLIGDREKASYTTRSSRVSPGWSVAPYSALKIVLRAVTNWGLGKQIVVQLRSPESVPGMPIGLRTFSRNVRLNIRALIFKVHSKGQSGPCVDSIEQTHINFMVYLSNTSYRTQSILCRQK